LTPRKPTLRPTADPTPFPSPRPVGCIEGNVKEDTDNNIIGDKAISSVPIAVIDSACKIIYQCETLVSTKTDARGNYQFCGLPAGSYKVAEFNLPDYIDVSDVEGDPLDNTIMVILAPGATVTGRNFVDRKMTASAPPTRSPTTQPTSAAPTLRPTSNPTPGPTPRPILILITKPPSATPKSCPCSSNSTVPTECEVKLLIKLLDFAVSGEHKLAAQWLRLSFHDAGTFNKAVRKGGANGCLMNHVPMQEKDENAGLHSAIESLKVVRDSWERIPSTCIDISAADIIQFAGHFSAVRQTDVPGITDAKVSQLLALKWGRIDEDNCQIDWTFNLPGFELNTDSEDVPLRCMMAGKEIKTR
jgi:hypothetical protein